MHNEIVVGTFSRQRAFVLLVLVGTFACSGAPPTSDDDGAHNALQGDAQAPAEGTYVSYKPPEAPVGGNVGRACWASSETPVFRIQGSACGVDVDYSSPESMNATGNAKIGLGRQSLFDDADFINVITVRDGAMNKTPEFPQYSEEYDLRFSLGLSDVAVELGTQSFTVTGGILHACGLGALAFLVDSEAEITFEGLDASHLRATISGLQVAGYSPEYGAASIPVCTEAGTLTVVLDGIYSLS